MDENASVREPGEPAARTRRLPEPGHGHRYDDWPDSLSEPYEPTPDELDLLNSQVPGHRWNAWRRLTGEEDYFAACSCGWHSTGTSHARSMLRHVKDHLDAVWAVRGWRPAPQTGQAPSWDKQKRDASQHERTRELYAAVENQQRRLAQALEHSTELLSASEDQAGRLLAALQHAADGVAPEWAKTEDSARRAEALQHQADRAKEVRDNIIATAATLAAIAADVALLNQDQVTRRSSGTADTSLWLG